MDVLLLCSLGVLLTGVLFVLWRILKLQKDESGVKPGLLPGVVEAERRPRAGVAVVGGQRRAGRGRGGGGGVRRRGPGGRGGWEDDDEEGEEAEEPRVRPRGPGGVAAPDLDRFGDEYSDEEDEFTAPDGGKLGKKKQAKLQMKAEKKAQREYDLQEREEKKKRDQEKDERRKKEEEKEKMVEEERLELERLEKEKKEQREQEEYEAMKSSFAVEEEGYDENETLDSENLLQTFIQHMKNAKVVNMDELAGHFKLKTSEVVERVEGLVEEGILTGVMDDRGKFIYISMEELEGVAKFINQRGRVSVSELAEYSNTLIRLQPVIETTSS